MFVETFNNQTFYQNGNESAILKIKFYNPQNLIFQHLAVPEKFGKIEVNNMMNGHIIDTLTSVDNCEVVKRGGKVIKIYEGVIYRENFEISPFGKVLEKLFVLGQKHKHEKKIYCSG